MKRLVPILLVVLATTPALLPQAGGSEPERSGVWPLSPAPPVLHRFEPPSVRWGAGHRGVDLLAAPGQQVRAAVPGTVAFAGTVAGTPVVSLDHPDGTRTTHQPVVTTLAVGTEVGAGEALGMLVPGASHCAPALCLHWGLKRGAEYLDPLSLVAPARVRLLPL